MRGSAGMDAEAGAGPVAARAGADGTQRAGAQARGLDLGRRAVRHQALERRIGARGGVAARGAGSAEVRGWS
jgi:hypothetical protein